ncbi:fibronectin type III domain-containing protein 1 isoform 1-T1 [Synchiropus picturatus]
MALAASRTLFALFVTLCAPGPGWTAEKPPRPHSGRQTAVDKSLRERWEPSIHLDGRPVDRFVISTNKPLRTHRFTKIGTDSKPHDVEDVDPEWVNLDGFAVLGGAPVRNSSAGPFRSANARRSVVRAARVDRNTHPSSSSSRIQRRAPQSSLGPGQPKRLLSRARLLERRRQHAIQPQADQRNRQKLTSESVHVVSLQAQKAPSQSVPANRASAAKATTPEPPDYVARDISVRVMSAQSVLISWIDPAVEMGKIDPYETRSYTVRFREKGESARWEYKESMQKRMLIDNLAADGMYEFAVRISQGENEGKWSVSVFQRTPESAPSGPPENFEVKPLRGKGTAVTATWDPPEEPNGRIREYILSYAPALKPFGMKSVTYRGSTTSATIEGLTPGDRYIFKIRATNRRGQGPQSKALTVVMPGSSRSAPSTSVSKDTRRTDLAHNNSPDEEETGPVLRSTKTPEEPTTITPQSPAKTSSNRHERILPHTSAYHSVFSLDRVRNGANRDSSRRIAQDRKNEEEEEKEEEQLEEVVHTTQTTVKETPKAVAQDPRKQGNEVSPEPEEETDSGEENVLDTHETPSLKYVTSPTKTPSVSQNKRRPVKIRVHQRPGGHSTTTVTLLSPVSTTPLPSRKDSTLKNDRNIYTNPSVTATRKPSAKESQNQRGNTQVGKAAGGRTGGSSFGSRYGLGRRQFPLLRGNATRVLNGYKPSSSMPSTNSALNLPSRTSHNPNTAMSQSTLPDSKTQERTNNVNTETMEDPKMTNTVYPAASKTDSEDTLPSKTSSDRYDAVGSTSEPSGSTNTHKHVRPNNPSTSRSESPSLGVSQSSLKNVNPSPTSSGTHVAGKDEDRNVDRGDREKFEPASNHEEKVKEEDKKDQARVSSSNTKPVITRTRNPTFAERFLYPSRTGSRVVTARNGARLPWSRSSTPSVAGRSTSRGTSTRVSGATGAAGVSSIQETSEDSRTSSSSLKNEVGTNSFKPSLESGNDDNRTPTTTLSTALSTEANSNKHQEDDAEETSKSSNDHNQEYLDAGNREPQQEKEKEPAIMEKSPTSAPQQTLKDNESSNIKETQSRIRPGSASVLPSNRRPTFGRARNPLLFNRQSGGSKLTRPQSNSRSPDASSSLPGSSSSSNAPQSVLTPDSSTGSVAKTESPSEDKAASAPSVRDSSRGQGGRSRYPIMRKAINGGGTKPGVGNGKNGRPNLTEADKDASSSSGTSKATGQRLITGPDGNKWIVDLEHGVLMNQDGRILQDSQGKPKRVVLGEDGRTIFDHMGSPLLNHEGMALFGHGRDSRPVVNPKDKVLMVGGKPLLGLDLPQRRTAKTTTATTTTTTLATTTTHEPTTAEWTTEEYTSPSYPTCPPGTIPRTDDAGNPILEPEGGLDCLPEEESSGMEVDNMVPDALDLEKDEVFTSVPPTTATTVTPVVGSRPHNRGPLNAFDLSGKKRFTAPYVNYIQKDPGAPCSLNEALDYLQVDIIEELMEKDKLTNQNQPPKHKPHNLTVVAMEGCHSFIILDWAQPLKGDMVSGYMVHSASYDDVLNNRWSSSTSSGTHLAVENLKPNSRYYFKVQARNVFGLGPFSDTLTYVTESDDPLLIERPPGGEPIWIPFTFKYNQAHSACKGSQFVKRTWYRKFVGVVLCNSLRYKIFMGNGLREPFYSIGDTFGEGEDHCQFVDSYRDGRTGPSYMSNYLPSANGFYRAFRQEPVTFGVIGRRTAHPFVGWYECGVPIPGKW